MAALEIGASLIPFALPGTDGKIHRTEDYQDKRALAVIFTCNHCPYAQAWEGRLIQLQREYASRGVQFLLINPNDATKYPEDSFENMVRRAEEKG
ncbi:MAG: redoxin domain-containing protein, partial [Armatimonadota bacterium]|nr:redoxin domain-containing protein [Armatimonadota bacterium]